jgi:hypothetical protein
MTDLDVALNPTIDAEGELSISEARLCPGCGRPESLWRENDGCGYEGIDGATYCCRGCADETGCTCG